MTNRIHPLALVAALGMGGLAGTDSLLADGPPPPRPRTAWP